MAILGIDEVGRGPLAGPLVVGAVILPEGEHDWFDELNDSKKLTAKNKENNDTKNNMGHACRNLKRTSPTRRRRIR